MDKSVIQRNKVSNTNNNFFSTFFLAKKGIRQGVPLSPTTFVLCKEYLAIILRQNAQYCGLEIGTELIKVLLFAGDTVIYLNDRATQYTCLQF